MKKLYVIRVTAIVDDATFVVPADGSIKASLKELVEEELVPTLEACADGIKVVGLQVS